MTTRKTSRRFRYPAALLTVAMLLGTSATPAAAAIDAVAIQAKAEAALAERLKRTRAIAPLPAEAMRGSLSVALGRWMGPGQSVG